MNTLVVTTVTGKLQEAIRSAEDDAWELYEAYFCGGRDWVVIFVVPRTAIAGELLEVKTESRFDAAEAFEHDIIDKDEYRELLGLAPRDVPHGASELDNGALLVARFEDGSFVSVMPG